MALKKSIRIAVVSLSLLLLILGFLSYGRFSAISGTNYTSALWIGSQEGLAKISAENGASLLKVPVRDSIRGLGVDEWNGRVWVLSDRTLYSYTFDGSRVLAVPLSGKLDRCGLGDGGRFPLAVDSSDGSVFISVDERILRFAPDGVLQSSMRLHHDVEEMAYDPVHSLLFASVREKVFSFEETGKYVGASSLGRHSRAVDMASSSGDLYVALEDSIVKYSHDLTPLSEVRLRDVKRIASDAAGLWAATDRTLHRVDSSLSVRFRKDLREEIVDLASDGITCWVLGKKNLFHIGQRGELLLSVKACPRGDAQAVALYRDSIGPTVRIVSPARGAYLNSRTPTIELSWSDVGSGVASSTVSFQANGASVPSVCTDKTGGAVCTLGAALTEGANTLAVTVKDGEGNASSPSQVSFTVDVTPPAITVSSPRNGLITNKASQSLTGSVSEPGTLTVNGESVSLDGSNQFTKAVTLVEGSNTIHVVASDLAGNTASVDLGATLDTVAPGIAVSGLVTVSRSVDGEAAVTGASGSVEPNAWVVVTNLRTGETFSVLSGSDGSFSLKISALAGDALSITVRDAAGNTGQGFSTTVRMPEASENIPVGSFGDTYRDLVPANATLASYDTKRFSLITGIVWDKAGTPLAGVTVSILFHPEYGTVKTGSDGRFNIPVEGGGPLTAAYQKSGFITSHRMVNVPWNDIAIAETVRMIAEDSASTAVTFDGNSSTVITHRSTEVTDASGKRSCTLVFTGDNHAYSVDATGNTIGELSSIAARATEFKTPDSMPAQLPPNSAYTYCAELTVDGVERVKFEKPVTVWVENFLGFPVGETVPVGYYDRDEGVWIPSDSGVVVRLLDTDGDGIADAVDATGDRQPDDLSGDGNTSDEAAGLGDPAKYPPGATFWRFTVTHFTSWDSNWAFSPPDDAIYPDSATASVYNQQTENKDCKGSYGSFVEERSGILHEDLPIPGTNMTLHYASNRVSGFGHLITVPATGASVPPSLKKAIVRVEVAGRSFEGEVDPIAYQQQTFGWDGLDQFGRRASDVTKAQVSVGYVYPGVYQKTDRFGYNGNGMIEGSLTRQEVTFWRKAEVVLQSGSSVIRQKGMIADGWSLSAHHYVNPVDPTTLLKGDGTIEKTTLGITTSSGVVTTAAGTGNEGFSGDGGYGTQAMLHAPLHASTDSAGNLYIADVQNNRIRKLDPNGIITTAAYLDACRKAVVDARGNMYIVEWLTGCMQKMSAEGTVIARTCGLGHPDSVAVDPWGNVYVAEQYSNRVRKIDPGGLRANTIISGGFSYITDVATDASGNLYIADRDGCRVARMDRSGKLTTVAGTTGACGYSGDGGPATSARLGNVYGIHADVWGNLFIGDSPHGSVRKVDTHGNITTVAGTGTRGGGVDGAAATQTPLPAVYGVAADPGGSLYMVEADDNRVQKVSVPCGLIRKTEAGELAFAEKNGLGHVFTGAGQHERTVDLDTDVILSSFEYTAENELASIRDRFGNVTTIERDGNGIPTAIVSPDGIRTVLGVDANGRLSSVQYADGSRRLLEYSSEGLLTAKVDGDKNRFDHEFDSTGRLTRESDQEGGSWTFSRTAKANGELTTRRSTAEGNVTTYVDLTDSTGAYSTTITDPTGGETVFTQSASGLKVSKMLPCGKSLAFDYSTDAQFLFPIMNEMTETTPSGLKKTTAFGKAYQDSDGDGAPDWIVRSVSLNGNQWTTLNDTLAGRRTTTSPLGKTAVLSYDTANLLASGISVPGYYDTSLGYDARGRLVSFGAGARQWTTAYDSVGNVSSVTDPASRTTAYSHDAVGRLTGVMRPDGTGLAYAYDANGNLTVLATPKSASHSFGYNKVNLGASYATPTSGSYSYFYDRERRPARVLFPSGKEILYQYDPARLARIETAEGDIEFTYNCSSMVGSVAKGDETIIYGYDGPLVTGETSTGTLAQALSYTYGNDLKVVNFTYAGKTVSHTYDADGLLAAAGDFTIARNSSNGLPEAVSAFLPISAAALFHENGPSPSALARVMDVDLPPSSPKNLGIRARERVKLAISIDPGTTTTTEPPPPEPPSDPTAGTLKLSRSFNGYGELDGESYDVFTDVSNGVPYAWSVTRDNAGRIVSRKETLSSVATEYAYSYDPLGRLLAVSQDGNIIEQYAYDADGNRISQMSTARGISRTLSYSDEDHVLTAGDVSYEHDADGFLRKKTRGGVETAYTYSSRGELLRAALPDGRIVEYVYDPLGRRIAKKIDGAVKEKYLWQGRTQLLAVFDANDQLVMRFSYADGRMPLSVTRWDLNYFLFYDQAGSLRMVTDPTGVLVKQVEYDSFGNVLSDSNPGFAIPFGFAGGLYDPDTGLVRFGCRDYDPDTGRWTAKDPILFEGGDANLYGYVQNDPINFIDPQGLSGWAIDAGGAYGTGWGGSSNSSSGLAGAGFYIGATGPSNYAEIGAFIYQGTGVTAGAEIGAGYTLTRYKIDAKDFFQGETYYKKTTFLGATYTKYYDACGNDIGWSVSLGGRGVGFATGSGIIQGVQGALQ